MASNGSGGERAARWLALAAAPTFALMALLSLPGFGVPPAMSCMAPHGAGWLSGMAPMYLLMSAFHCGAWLKLALQPRDAPSG
jgi:hypothetical protein